MTIKYDPTEKTRPLREVLDEILGERTFNDLLKSIRLGLEITQVEMAKKLKISRQELCDIEKGRKSVSVDRAVYFAKRLKHSQKLFALYVIEDQLRKSGLKVKVRLEDAA